MKYIGKYKDRFKRNYIEFTFKEWLLWNNELKMFFEDVSKHQVDVELLYKTLTSYLKRYEWNNLQLNRNKWKEQDKLRHKISIYVDKIVDIEKNSERVDDLLDKYRKMYFKQHEEIVV